MTMADLFGGQPLRVVHPNAYARTPGTGPAGCTCADCAHLFHKTGRSGRRYYKCRKAQHDATPATDVRKSMPACACFAAREADMSITNPFARPKPGLPDLQVAASADRVALVRDFDRAQCEAALAVPDLQLTVRRAIRTRLRQLARAEAVEG